MGPLTLGLSRWTLALRFLPCRRAAPDFAMPLLRQGVPCQISTFSFRTVSLLARTSPGSQIETPRAGDSDDRAAHDHDGSGR